jgi:hypothetical protein
MVDGVSGVHSLLVHEVVAEVFENDFVLAIIQSKYYYFLLLLLFFKHFLKLKFNKKLKDLKMEENIVQATDTNINRATQKYSISNYTSNKREVF